MSVTSAELTKIFRTSKIFDQFLKKINIISLAGGKCIAEIKVEEEHANESGKLQPGFSAALVDTLSTFTLSTYKHGTYPTVHINVEYIDDAKVGDEIQVTVDTLKVGKTAALMEVLVKDKNTGNLLVKGSQRNLVLEA